MIKTYNWFPEPGVTVKEIHDTVNDLWACEEVTDKQGNKHKNKDAFDEYKKIRKAHIEKEISDPVRKAEALAKEEIQVVETING